MQNQRQNQKGLEITDNIFGRIFTADNLQKQQNEKKQLSPQFLQMKNNLLILILCGTLYGLHYLFKEYLDTIIIGFLSGIAYQHISFKFINFWKFDAAQINNQTNKEINLVQQNIKDVFKIKTKKSKSINKQQNKMSIIFETLISIIIFILLPWIRHICSQDINKAHINLSIEQIWKQFFMTKNIIIRCVQIYLFIKIICNIAGNSLKRIVLIRDMTSRQQSILRGIFVFLIIIAFLSLFVIVPTILVKEGGKIVFTTVEAIQKTFNCILYNKTAQFSQLNARPLCTNKIPMEYITSLIIINQTKIQQCEHYLNKREYELIGYDLFSYEQYICRFGEIVSSASPNLLQSSEIVATGQKLFSLIFGNLAIILTSISNIIFSITTYITILLITVKYFNPKNNTILRIFGEGKNPLVNQVSDLIEATVLITFEHFLMSIVLFDIFRFSDINFLLSLLLALCAFIPVFQPFFFVTLFTTIKCIYTGQYVVSLICLACYYYGSNQIYKLYYSSINFHQVIINLSILLGIYQFGVTGIFYGPLLIMFFSTVCEELLNPGAKNRSPIMFQFFVQNIIYSNKIILISIIHLIIYTYCQLQRLQNCLFRLSVWDISIHLFLTVISDISFIFQYNVSDTANIFHLFWLIAASSFYCLSLANYCIFLFL